MQQDDQNTLKYLTNPMDTENAAKPYHRHSSPKANIIEKRNLLHEGINYIVPSFWYQQLVQVNHGVKQLQNLKCPSLENYVHFIELCGLQKYYVDYYNSPQELALGIKQQFPRDSALYGSDILDDRHYISSKTLLFSKINNFVHRNQVEWSIINSLLWNLIETKFWLSEQGQDIDALEIQKPIKNQTMHQSSRLNKTMPKISVFFTKQFILQNGKSKGKQLNNAICQSFITFLYKNVKYTVPESSVKNQISNQLNKVSPNPISLTLFIDQTLRKQNFYRKIYVQGYFSLDVPFKELLKSLAEVESLRRVQNPQKFYVYDQFGEKISQKITTVENFIQLSAEKKFIFCMTPLNEMLNFYSYTRNSLVQMLKKDFNFPEQSKKEINQSEKQEIESQKLINQMAIFFGKFSKETQLHYVLKSLKKNPQNQQKKMASVTSGFRPFSRQQSQIKILSGTFYRSDDQIKEEKNENSRQNDDARYLDSATTNMDTPLVDFQNHSQKVHSQSSYSNVRLKKHSSYNRTQRKKKSQSYLQKKKKNNYILRGNSANVESSNDFGDYKKRLKHPLFESLSSLQDEPQVLQFLIENMRNVAIESIYAPDYQLIQPPYQDALLSLINQNSKSSLENTQTKGSFQYLCPKEAQKSQKEKQSQRKRLQQSLRRISDQIQRFYEPEIELEKGADDQKIYQKLIFDKMYEWYQAQKKDNEEIKTIVDNSQGPYSQIEKQPLNIKYRGTQKALQKIIIENEQNQELNYMSDALNQIEDNEETI